MVFCLLNLRRVVQLVGSRISGGERGNSMRVSLWRFWDVGLAVMFAALTTDCSQHHHDMYTVVDPVGVGATPDAMLITLGDLAMCVWALCPTP